MNIGIVNRRSSAGVATRRARYLLDLLRELVLRDINVRYRRSMLGIVWSFLSPLLLLAVFYFVFQIVITLNVDRYPSFVLTGLLVWTWLHSSLTQSATSIVANGELLRLPGFPPALLPLATVSTNLFYFLISLPVLALFLLVGGSRFEPGVLLALPVVIAVQFALTLGLAYIIATVNVLFRDTEHVLDPLLRVLMFMSPVFYEATFVPERYRAIYDLNPIVHLLDAYRALLIAGDAPDWWSLAWLALGSAGLLYIGQKALRYYSNRFVDEL